MRKRICRGLGIVELTLRWAWTVLRSYLITFWQMAHWKGRDSVSHLPYLERTKVFSVRTVIESFVVDLDSWNERWNLLSVFYFSVSFLPAWIRIGIANPDPGTPLNPDPQHCRLRYWKIFFIFLCHTETAASSSSFFLTRNISYFFLICRNTEIIPGKSVATFHEVADSGFSLCVIIFYCSFNCG